jgi:hypothetical protein
MVFRSYEISLKQNWFVRRIVTGLIRKIELTAYGATIRHPY